MFDLFLLSLQRNLQKRFFFHYLHSYLMPWRAPGNIGSFFRLACWRNWEKAGRKSHGQRYKEKGQVWVQGHTTVFNVYFAAFEKGWPLHGSVALPTTTDAAPMEVFPLLLGPPPRAVHGDGGTEIPRFPFGAKFLVVLFRCIRSYFWHQNKCTLQRQENNK